MAKKSSKSVNEGSQSSAKAPKKVAPEKAPMVKSVEDKKVTDKKVKQVSFNKPKLIKAFGIVALVVVTVILVDLAVQYLNNDYSVAMVNGERIAQSEFEDRLESAYGEIIASQMITEKLIEQEAEKKDLTVSDEDIEGVVNKTIEDIGGEEAFESALLANSLTLDSYKRNIKIQKLAEKLIVTQPTDEEIQKFFDDNKSVYWQEEGVVFENVKDEAKDYLVAERFNEKSQEWLTGLKEGAQIQDNSVSKKPYRILSIVREYVENMNSKSTEPVVE